MLSSRSKENGTRLRGPASLNNDPGFYLYAITTCLVIAAMLAGFGLYRLAFNKVTIKATTRFDLSSLFIKGSAGVMDPANPCIVVQEYLEAARTGRYEDAYDLLATSLRDITPIEEFIKNVGRNGPLFKNVERYDFNKVEIQGDIAQLAGYIDYAGSGRSEVKARFVRQGDSWRLALITVAYE